MHELAEDDDGRDIIILYVGDFDPSGLYMSEEDLPNRFDRYGGYHLQVRRVALLESDLPGLPGLPVKPKDPRIKWW
jgi:hypothetical protein